jgi:hypothetical protein
MIRRNVDVIAATVLLLTFAIMSQGRRVLEISPIVVNAKLIRCERMRPVLRAVALPFFRANAFFQTNQ